MSLPGSTVDRDATQVPDRLVERSGEDGPAALPGPSRRRTGRILLIVLLALVLLGGAGVLSAGLYVRSVEKGIERVDAFEAVPPQERPERVAQGALNLLVLGSDSRDPQNATGSRSDTIILMHLSGDRSSAQLVSIPRDTWMYVPRSDEGRGGVEAKVNAAFAWGGVPLMVRAVERFTRVRIDHVVMVDFAGFKEIVDALGGVEIDVAESFTSTHSLNPDSVRHFRKGRQTMDGAAALDYARERFAFRDGDFARIRHQQQVIKAILDKASSGGLLANPVGLNAFLRATADAVAVDGTLDVMGLAMQLRHMRSGNLSFYTSPTRGTGRIGTQSVVLPDTARAKSLYDAVRRDDPDRIRAIGGPS